MIVVEPNENTFNKVDDNSTSWKKKNINHTAPGLHKPLSEVNLENMQPLELEAVFNFSIQINNDFFSLCPSTLYVDQVSVARA